MRGEIRFQGIFYICLAIKSNKKNIKLFIKKKYIYNHMKIYVGHLITVLSGGGRYSVHICKINVWSKLKHVLSFSIFARSPQSDNSGWVKSIFQSV